MLQTFGTPTQGKNTDREIKPAIDKLRSHQFDKTPRKSRKVILKGKIILVLRMGHTITPCVRTMYSSVSDGLEIEAENEKIKD